jgi:integrase
MTTDKKTLSTKDIKALKAGEKISEKGITYRRLNNGDGVYEVNKMVNRERIHRVLGKESEGMTLTLAKAQVEKLMTESREQRSSLPKGRKIEQSVQEASQTYLRRLSECEGKNLEKKEMHFRLHLNPFFGKIPITHLNNFDIERYKKARKEEGAKPATTNRELGTLLHLLSMAEEWGWIRHKPCKVKMIPLDNRRIECLTRDEAQRLLSVAQEDRHPQIYLFIAIGLDTAMRRTEILSLRLEHLHLAQRQVFLPKTKAGARTQPITQRVADLIEAYIRMRPMKSEWLFPAIGAIKSKTGYTTCIEDPFRRVVEKAGLDPKRITPHVLRHTAISNLIMAGIDIPTVQAISGHKTVQMVMRYTHQHNDHVLNALDKLEIAYQNGDAKVIPMKNYTEITQKHEFGLGSNSQNAMMTRGKARKEKYTWLEAFRTSLTETSPTLGRQMLQLLTSSA